MQPYAHQSRFIQTAPPKWGVWHSTGTGKTITGILKVYDRVSTCLVICPKGVKSKWEKIVKQFSRPFGKAVFTIVTKEQFRKSWEEIGYHDAVIIDEAHHFSGIKSQMHKSFLKYSKKYQPKYVYPMTATPFRREPWNIYALAKLLGLDWDYMKFRYTFYREQRFGPRVVWVPKKGMEQEIAQLVRSIGDVVSYSECADMPPVTHKIEYVEPTKDQEFAMERLETTEANPLTYYLREHQIMSGVLYMPTCDAILRSAKEEYIIDLCEVNNKVAVFCRYTEQINYLQRMLTDAGYATFVIDGRTKDKNAVAEAVEKSLKSVVIIQADSAEGFELPSISVVVFASMSYSYLAYTQSLGRFIRINKANTPKLFVYLLTKGTIDEDVYKNIMKKQDFDLAIYSQQKHGKPNN